MSGIYYVWDRDTDDVRQVDTLTSFRSADDRRVAKTTLSGGTYISTIFLGIDHGFSDGPPLVFETMVFPSADDMSDMDCERYSTAAEAREGHERMVEKWSGMAVRDSVDAR